MLCGSYHTVLRTLSFDGAARPVFGSWSIPKACLSIIATRNQWIKNCMIQRNQQERKLQSNFLPWMSQYEPMLQWLEQVCINTQAFWKRPTNDQWAGLSILELYSSTNVAHKTFWFSCKCCNAATGSALWIGHPWPMLELLHVLGDPVSDPQSRILEAQNYDSQQCKQVSKLNKYQLDCNGACIYSIY